jgi:chromosome segregation ATPase
MKNIKDILILVLLGLALIFAWTTFFGGDALYKHKVKELEADNKRLQEERKSIDAKILVIQAKFDSLSVEDKKLQGIIEVKDAEIDKNKKSAARSKAELDTIRKRLEETRKQIEEAKKNPPNREGQDLINSLKIKTQ